MNGKCHLHKISDTLSFSNLKFMNGNCSRGGGGAIYAKNINNLSFTDCEVINNKTSNCGGGICVITNAQIQTDVSLTNCTITQNNCSLGKGNGVYFETGENSKMYIDNCCFVNNGNNSNMDIGGGLYIISNTEQDDGLVLKNTVFKGNSAATGGGVYLDLKQGSPTGIISNCTFNGNISDDNTGHCIYIVTYDSDCQINSCTIADNGSETGSIIYYTKDENVAAYLDLKNSILMNTGTNFIGNHVNYSADPPEFSRSYTISNDESMPLTEGTGNFNNTDPMITLGKEVVPAFYKPLPGSPAKDAIPRGEDVNNPFNGAGQFLYKIIDGVIVPTLDQNGNIQVLDQRGFNFWNQAKDIGAYESPYYWVDVAADREYKTIPNWKTELTIADPVEGWTDFVRAQTGGRIILTENSEIYRDDNSELKWNDGSFMDVAANSRIMNGLDFISAATINIFDNAQLSMQLSRSTVPAAVSFTVGVNSKLIIDNGSSINLPAGLNMNFADGARLTVKNTGTLTALGATLSSMNISSKWLGINCEGGSTVKITNSTINNAETGVSGLPKTCVIQNTTFDQCVSGVEVAGCDSLLIKSNILNGRFDAGTGVSLTQTNGWIIDNTISGYYKGVTAISCAPYIFDNTILGNKHSGLSVTGLNSVPVLIKPINHQLPAYYLNNKIYGNGYIPDDPLPSVITPGQICLTNGSSIMMKYGHNNVYSNPLNTAPEIPCLVAARLIPEGEIQIPRNIVLSVEGNYWGSSDVTDGFFTEGGGYSVFYDPYHTQPWGQIPSTVSYPEPDSKSYDLLLKAIDAEFDYKNDKAIKEYEKIIEKYPYSDEAVVAYAKLPGSYSEQNLGLDTLISLYDAQISSTDENVNKKFFKEMKVTTHLKAKNYDAAIALSEEMKLEADTGEEETLCDIDIAIANLLKDSGKGSINNADQREILKGLYAKLGNGKTEPAGIREESLPQTVKLYQNYPNPFNPVTQIGFDLANKSDVKLRVYNVSGQVIAELAKGVMNAGSHSVEFDGSRLNSGVYYYTLEVDGKNITKKMVLTK